MSLTYELVQKRIALEIHRNDHSEAERLRAVKAELDSEARDPEPAPKWPDIDEKALICIKAHSSPNRQGRTGGHGR